jgi:hypothetical protein
MNKKKIEKIEAEQENFKKNLDLAMKNYGEVFFKLLFDVVNIKSELEAIKSDYCIKNQDQNSTFECLRSYKNLTNEKIIKLEEVLLNCNCNSVKVSTLINVIIIVMITLAFIMLFIFKRSQKNSTLEQNVIEITNDNYKHRQLSVKKKCEIEVCDYETPLPVEEHIYDELHL